MLDDLDFTKLKLPIEPKNLIYIYLAYKLINNLDKLQIQNLPMRHLNPMPSPRTSSNLLSLVLLMVGVSFIMFQRLVGLFSESSSRYACPVIESNRNQCPLKNMKKCPVRMCPLFQSEESLQKMLAEKLLKTENESVPSEDGKEKEI